MTDRVLWRGEEAVATMRELLDGNVVVSLSATTLGGAQEAARFMEAVQRWFPGTEWAAGIQSPGQSRPGGTASSGGAS